MLKINKKPTKITIIIASVLVFISMVALLVLGWVGSSKVMAVNRQQVVYDQTINRIDDNTYTILGSAYDVDGIMGGIRSDGSFMGIFSKPNNLNSSTKTSTRVLTSPIGALPKVGDKISLQGNIWASNPMEALGLDYHNVTYKSSVGTMSAWLIDGAKTSTWTIGVHGIGADKTEMLRFIKPVHVSGDTMLAINYRNDVSNPASPDKRNNLGNTEWQDLEAAVDYARTHGATKIRLYGDSLGGSLVENYLKRAKDTGIIDKVVLDSPALNWEQILKYRAKTSGFPAISYYPTALFLRLRAGISIDRISTHAADIKHQTLIIHSSDDPSVPQSASKLLADERPDMITLVDFGGGGHLRSWNYDSERYETVVRNFLKH